MAVPEPSDGEIDWKQTSVKLTCWFARSLVRFRRLYLPLLEAAHG